MSASSTSQDHWGHESDRPRDIPGPGWWDILKRVYAALGNKNISILAAGVAFYAMFSIFPALAALISIYGIVANPATVQHQITAMHGVIPAEAQGIIADYLKSIVSSQSSTLGVSLIIGILAALWSARAGATSLIEALNIIYEEPEKRGMIRFQLVALGMTVAAIVFIILALVLIAAIPAIVQWLPIGKTLQALGYFLPWPLLIILMSLVLTVTYRYAPSRREPKWRWVSWGGAAATLLWIVASALFSVYVAKFSSYNKTFGSLGAVVVLLMWLYLSAYVVLLGACLNAEMEHQTAQDTTEGGRKPMGSRGAKMADTVA